MKIGFCNHMSFSIPEGVTVFLESPTQVTLFSIDYLLVKQTAASLRAFRPPDAYKGKGFRYMSEILVLKEVKKNG
jgi:large subunit ribosomal protein L6